MLTVNNMLRDGIKPDVTLFAQCHIEKMDGRDVILIDIQSGTDRPYYLVGKGIRPDGVYVRHGTASVPATDTAILKMIRETGGDCYEKRRSAAGIILRELVKQGKLSSDGHSRNVRYFANK